MLFNFPSDDPSLESMYPLVQGCVLNIPVNLASSVPTDPLAVDIQVDVDIDVARDIDRKITSRNGLP